MLCALYAPCSVLGTWCLALGAWCLGFADSCARHIGTQMAEAGHELSPFGLGESQKGNAAYALY